MPRSSPKRKRHPQEARPPTTNPIDVPTAGLRGWHVFHHLVASELRTYTILPPNEGTACAIDVVSYCSIQFSTGIVSHIRCSIPTYMWVGRRAGRDPPFVFVHEPPRSQDAHLQVFGNAELLTFPCQHAVYKGLALACTTHFLPSCGLSAIKCYKTENTTTRQGGCTTCYGWFRCCRILLENATLQNS